MSHQRSPAQLNSDKSPKLKYVEYRWSVGGNEEVSTCHMMYLYTVCMDMESTSLYMCSSVMLTHIHMSPRNNNNSSTNLSNQSAVNLSISSKILTQMEKIISIIKVMGNSFSKEEVKQLNRLLYRATDNLMELELSLHQLQVKYTSHKPNLYLRSIKHLILCPACAKPWPHDDQVEKLSKNTVSSPKQE